MRTIILLIAILVASLIASLNIFSKDAKKDVQKADTKFIDEKLSNFELSKNNSLNIETIYSFYVL